MRHFTQPSFAGRAGVARRDITPPIGIYARNWGAALHDRAEGVHRSLTATAVALAADGDPVVLIALDAGWWKLPQDEWLVRGGILEAIGLPAECVMVNLSHTHSGPCISSADVALPGGDLIPPYLLHMRDAAAGAARAAIAALEPATVTWRYGHCGLAQNRGFPDPQRPRLVCGFNPDATPDGTVLVGRISAEDGRPLGTLVNYACHGTTLGPGNRLLSPDFVGAMREVVEAQTGGAPCGFLQGTSGDLAPRLQYVADPAVADTHGRELGHAVLAALAGMLPPRTALEYRGAIESGAVLGDWQPAAYEPGTTLDARRLEVEVPLKPFGDAGDGDERVRAERLKRRRQTQLLVGDGPTTRLPLWIWRIGDGIVVGHRDECFSDFQIQLRRRFPPAAVTVMNCVNGAEGGYLAPAGEYDVERYETWQSPYARGSYELLLDAALRYAGALP